MTVRRFAVIAGGGTAGHVQPALALAEALVERGHDRDEVLLVGSARGSDQVVMEDRGFPVDVLPGRGVARSLAPRALVRNLGAVAGISLGVVRSLRLVRSARPSVVVAVGGYASVGPAFAALATGTPLVVVNVDAVPGAANRLFGRFAAACLVGWPGTDLPRAVVTGTPVRPEISAVGRDADARRAARRQLGLPEDPPTVVAFGGSLGARRVNEAVAGMAARWDGRGDRSVYHVVGRRDWEAGVGCTGPGPIVRVPYEERMALVYTAADLVICRAGAMTVAELAAAGVPAVLVPLPGAPGDHQGANARVLERSGAATVVTDAECTSERLTELVDGLLGSPDRLAAMAGAARALAPVDAAGAGAEVIETCARRRWWTREVS
ncbi:MAG: UDP-N-acetylglucosamine--N-acetylmuramyl-(pentapeptide) pyrophosphoryl-undecaprenol N-acetylglucosamine transferase [Actinomycetota bacterium]|nr:UDP-N-acetylglucosamine--N-acetylmuramyl-(pentapeptide) pyrophosphoryl-undecaprenol N-acetylglucosamine transferase [Actinomycetota bacterium]